MQEQPKPEFVTSIRLSGEEHALLKALAKSEQRSLSGQLRYLLLRECEDRELASYVDARRAA